MFSVAHRSTHGPAFSSLIKTKNVSGPERKEVQIRLPGNSHTDYPPDFAQNSVPASVHNETLARSLINVH